MDNLGYGELGVYGGGILRGAPTPRIDHLASEGMRLLNFNVEAQCTPSRAALMTGRYAVRTGNGSVPIHTPRYGLVQWEITLPKLLSNAGYGAAPISLGSKAHCGSRSLSAGPVKFLPVESAMKLRWRNRGSAARALRQGPRAHALQHGARRARAGQLLSRPTAVDALHAERISRLSSAFVPALSPR
jgi:arylsulfatase A-like enzyme